MLATQTIAAELRRELTTTLANHLPVDPQAYPALAPFPEPTMLLDHLDASRAFSVDRDEVFAEILRWARVTNEVAAHRTALYAFLPGLPHVMKAVLCRCDMESEELFGELLVVAMERIRAYDPDRRSPHVLANLEMETRHELSRLLKARSRERSALGDLAESTSDVPTSEVGGPLAEPLDEFTATPRRYSFGPVLRLAESVFGELVADGTLDETDALLIVQRHLYDRTATEIGAELGLDRRTVVRRIERALERAGDEIRQRIEMAVPVF